MRLARGRSPPGRTSGIGRIVNSDTQQFRNGGVSELARDEPGDPAARHADRGRAGPVRHSAGLFARTLALPDMARSFAVTAQPARWTLSGPTAGLARPGVRLRDGNSGVRAAGPGRAGSGTADPAYADPARPDEAAVDGPGPGRQGRRGRAGRPSHAGGLATYPSAHRFRHVTYAMHNVLRAPVAQLDRAAAF
jgi:hypothetical protein